MLVQPTPVREFTWTVDVTDPQATFDAVVAHLQTADGQSKLGQSCAYRGPDGSKCAVGSILEGDFKSYTSYDGYVVEVNSSPIDVLLCKTQLFSFNQIPSQGVTRLLANLQDVHDDPANWRLGGLGRFVGHDKLAKIAQQFDIIYLPTERTPS